MGILGLNFGISKSKSDTKINKTETTDQTKSEATNATQANTSTTNQSTNSTGSTNSTQTGTQQSNTTKVNDTTGRTSLFGDNILAQLEGTVSSLLGSAKPASIADSTFNAEQFVNSSVSAAEAKSRDLLDQTQGALGDAIGANPLNSSMATLLLNRANNDASASVEGTRAAATSQAAQIENANKQIQMASSQQGTDLLTQLLSALKGGTQATTQTGTEGTTGTNTSSQSGTQTTAESSNQTTDTSAMQTIQQLVDALLSGTTTTVGTESTKGSGMTAGANLSLGK